MIYDSINAKNIVECTTLLKQDQLLDTLHSLEQKTFSLYKYISTGFKDSQKQQLINQVQECLDEFTNIKPKFSEESKYYKRIEQFITLLNQTAEYLKTTNTSTTIPAETLTEVNAQIQRLSSDLLQLETKLTNHINSGGDSGSDGNVDLSNYYTSSQIDANYYNKNQINTNYYNKTQINNEFRNVETALNTDLGRIWNIIGNISADTTPLIDQLKSIQTDITNLNNAIEQNTGNIGSANQEGTILYEIAQLKSKINETGQGISDELKHQISNNTKNIENLTSQVENLREADSTFITQTTMENYVRSLFFP